MRIPGSHLFDRLFRSYPLWLRVLLAAVAVVIFFVLLQALPNTQIAKGVAILTLAAILWFTNVVPIAITSLLIPVLGVVLEIIPTKTAFDDFGNPLIFLFLGGFVLAAALHKYEIDRWVAYRLVWLAGGKLWAVSVMLISVTVFMSMWVSNTSTTAIMIPIALGLLAMLQDRGLAENHFLILGVAYSASIGGMATLVGTAPNGIGATPLGYDFLDWMAVGVPAALIVYPSILIILRGYFKPNFNQKIDPEKMRVKLNMDRKSVLTLVVFLITIVLWMGEGYLGELTGLGTLRNVTAIVAVVLLGIMGLMSWEEMQKGVDWGILMLFGGGFTLGRILSETGASTFLAEQVLDNLDGLPVFLLIWFICIFMTALSEIMSNTATAALFVPMLIPIAQGLNLAPEMLVVPAALATSCGMMLPVGTPPNAIGYATGLINARHMMLAGMWIDIVGSFLVAAWCYIYYIWL